LRTRLIVAVVALSGLTAFAPAPLPRARRARGPDFDLARFQGLWKVATVETVTRRGKYAEDGWGATQVRVQGDKWTYFERGQRNASYRIRIDPTKAPATIDFFHLDDKEGRPYVFGLIRRKEGGIEILFSSMTLGQRAGSFDAPPLGWWVLTLRPDR
jgi:uncharacterized protein (TIGR03067 family)